MKYVGHLDIMRYFQKAIRRSRLPIRYSEGFNPHQLMSFAAPLGVGMTSEGEYMDIELKEYISPEEALRRLSEHMVDGMEVLQFCYLPDDSKNAMSSVTAASYVLTFKHPEDVSLPYEVYKTKAGEFFHQSKSISIVKKTKKGERIIDLKPLVFLFDVKEEQHAVSFEMLISTGSVDNIKPELVMEAYFDFLGVPLKEHAFFIHRKDIYTTMEQQFVSLGEVGYEE